MDRTEISAKAQELLDKYSVVLSPTVDAAELAIRMGFEVFNADLDADDEGFIAINTNEKAIFGAKTNRVIGISRNLDLAQKRFVIAHELGHYCLHYDESSPIYAHRDKRFKGEEEQDVDYFAACLLMPEKPFKAFYRAAKEIFGSNKERILSFLSKNFIAPVGSVERRISELAL